MFNSEIVGSDAFIEMPVSAQVLYFHLGMRADDDGFVNPQITMRMMGANGDDLRILLAKRFLLQFENGVVVVKHWRINNFIRKDRYKETNYIELKSTLRVKDNGAYTLDNTQGLPIGEVPWKSDSERRLTVGQPSVNAGEVRLGKVRIGKKESTPSQEAKDFFGQGSVYNDIRNLLIEKIPIEIVDRELSKFFRYWTEPNKSGTKVRWELEKTFDVKRRLHTWFDRVSSYQKVSSKGKGLI